MENLVGPYLMGPTYEQTMDPFKLPNMNSLSRFCDWSHGSVRLIEFHLVSLAIQRGLSWSATGLISLDASCSLVWATSLIRGRKKMITVMDLNLDNSLPLFLLHDILPVYLFFFVYLLLHKSFVIYWLLFFGLRNYRKRRNKRGKRRTSLLIEVRFWYDFPHFRLFKLIFQFNVYIAIIVVLSYIK